MPLYVGNTRVSKENRQNSSSLVSLTAAWTQIQPLLLKKGGKGLDTGAKIVLANWRGDAETRRFAGLGSSGRGDQAGTGKTRELLFPASGRKHQHRDGHLQNGGAHQQHWMVAGRILREPGQPHNMRWTNDRYTSRGLSDMLTMDFIKEPSHCLGHGGAEG